MPLNPKLVIVFCSSTILALSSCVRGLLLRKPRYSMLSLFKAFVTVFIGQSNKIFHPYQYPQWEPSHVDHATIHWWIKLMRWTLTFEKFIYCSHKLLLYLTFTHWGTMSAFLWSPWKICSGWFSDTVTLDNSWHNKSINKSYEIHL